MTRDCPIDVDAPCPDCDHALAGHIDGVAKWAIGFTSSCLTLGCRCGFDPAEAGRTCGDAT